MPKINHKLNAFQNQRVQNIKQPGKYLFTESKENSFLMKCKIDSTLYLLIKQLGITSEACLGLQKSCKFIISEEPQWNTNPISIYHLYFYYSCWRVFTALI